VLLAAELLCNWRARAYNKNTTNFKQRRRFIMNPDDENTPQDEQQDMPQAPQSGGDEMPEAPAPTVPPQEDGAEDTPEPTAPEEEEGDAEEETPPLEGDKEDGGKW
jgi:hypothetical protein